MMRACTYLAACLVLFGRTHPADAASQTNLITHNFQVTWKEGFASQFRPGRVFVVLSQTNKPEPRFLLGRTSLDAPLAYARDVSHSPVGGITVSAEFPPGYRFAQAIFDDNQDLRSANAPGNLYSDIQELPTDPASQRILNIQLTHQIPPESLPPDTEQVKFVKIQSKLLSEFHHRPIFLRAGIVLPRDYQLASQRHYPLWVRIGGLGERYDVVQRLMAANSEFQRTWNADETPRLVLLQLDGAGPYGDPYQVNSANNGPYGDALVQELIPFVEATFRAIDQPKARLLSGTSTGGWVALALQIFYPDFFNGAWSSCPDPVDFRAFELIDIYHDDNAFVNQYGFERPSTRDSRGDVKLTMRREVGAENVLGHGDSYTMSGQSWGAWNAVFGPRGADGLPVPIWDPLTGKIDRSVATQWQEYDLRLILDQRWSELAPKLRGKLHITAGESDAYFLNYAVHLLDQSLTRASPPSDASIAYGPGKGHGWSNLSLRQLLDEMAVAAQK
jgi:S-formylglutathione hydrolase FrmB